MSPVARPRVNGKQNPAVDGRTWDRTTDQGRCYQCKSKLYERLSALAARRALTAVLSGANADDLGDWCPRLRAAAEHGVVHPSWRQAFARMRSAASRVRLACRAPIREPPCLAPRVRAEEVKANYDLSPDLAPRADEVDRVRQRINPQSRPEEAPCAARVRTARRFSPATCCSNLRERWCRDRGRLTGQHAWAARLEWISSRFNAAENPLELQTFAAYSIASHFANARGRHAAD